MNELQLEELSSLKAIYFDEFITLDTKKFTYSFRILEDPNSLTLYLQFTPYYPECKPPILQIESLDLTDTQKGLLLNELLTIFEESKGECVLFSWNNHIRDYLNLYCNKKPQFKDNIAELNIHGAFSIDSKSFNETIPKPERLAPPLREIEFYSGESFIDRKSIFQSHIAKVTSVSDVDQFMEQLKSNKKVLNATHNILAYRLTDRVKWTLAQDSDDDGEHGAGGRLLHLLTIIDAMNVAVVVTRWFGGIKLGPDRFKHINNTARELLVRHGYAPTSDAGGNKKKKKK